MATMAWAGDVTAQQAMQQAKSFIQQREATGSRPKRAQGSAAQQLTMAKQISGLYVFNVKDNGGFVIVSNDDSTIPILGYSDTGAVDPDNMPDNMRAWLQGYADEIAWARENRAHKDTPSVHNSSRTGTAVKEPVLPLLKTTWDQGAPYNNLTPYYKKSGNSYSYSATYQSGYSHCATGCVATAMAQVMKYHEWPALTSEIPSYTWESANYTLTGLSATTFDWENMSNSYSGSETDDTATAIAKLMQYCGWSVQMDYGEESGSNSTNVATALKNYFDYNSTTTKCINRSNYSYAYWVDIMYNEVANRRPVVFGAQSSGGGHEFVIDGYQSEDYFHVNWGWGGMSDSYFKLSALDPDAQGIGGSSSDDGFHFGQEAVVGVQKSTENGTTLDLTPNSFSLSVGSITFNPSPATQGEETEITVRVYNNGSAEYDGDIGCEIQYYYNSKWNKVDDVCDVFLIPAKGNKDCKLTFTPSYTGSYRVRPYRGGYYLGSTTYSVTVNAASGNTSLDLTPSFVLESPFEYGNPYTLYGTHLKASVTLTNNNGSAYSGTVGWQLGNSSNYVVDEDMNGVTIGAHESIVLSVDVKGLNIGENYKLYGLYTKSGSWTGQYIPIKPAAAILTYAPDGTETFTKPSGTSYDASTNASTALVIDVTGTSINTIKPNSNPNTLYISDEPITVTEGGGNVVTYSSGSYSAGNISLTDGNNFYSPVDFTASNIEFTYTFTTGADGTNGWNSIMLPFNVTSVTANDNPIDWFHSDTDEGKNFWVKKFTSDVANNVYFDYAEAMEANTPYIVAFPGGKWGPNWDMSNKTIKFIGSGTVCNSGALSSVTGANYRFIGSTTQDNTANIYCLNATGSAFEQVPTAGSGPFRAYFKPGTFDRTVTLLGIGSGTGETTSITTTNYTKETNGEWYTLDGRRLEGEPTQKGVYIVNGKKRIVK